MSHHQFFRSSTSLRGISKLLVMSHVKVTNVHSIIYIHTHTCMRNSRTGAKESLACIIVKIIEKSCRKTNSCKIHFKLYTTRSTLIYPQASTTLGLLLTQSFTVLVICTIVGQLGTGASGAIYQVSLLTLVPLPTLLFVKLNNV